MTFDLNLVGLYLGFSFLLAFLVDWPGPSTWDFQQFCKYSLTLDVVFPFWTSLLEAMLISFLNNPLPYSPLLSLKRAGCLLFVLVCPALPF